MDLTGKIFDTADKAKETPADIYIERLASKVRATGLKESTVQEYNDAKELTAAKYTIHTLNAANEVEITADKNLSVELTGWRLRNTATNNYAIKNLLNSWLTAAPFDAWNISELHRSYWTNPSSSSDTDIAHVDFDIYNEAEFSNKNFIAETPTANIVYCYENTIQPASLSDRDNKSTAIVVRGIVKMDNQPVNLCKWGGDYYTEDALKQVIINTYNMNVNEGDRLTAEAVGFKAYTKTENNDAKSNTWYAYVQTQTGEVHNGYRFSNISRWVDGQTSYVVNVKHMGDKFGVVRNHIYDYEFTDVVGLGVPGNNPKNPDPETETYLAARVHVLNWHVVSNKVILE